MVLKKKCKILSWHSAASVQLLVVRNKGTSSAKTALFIRKWKTVRSSGPCYLAVYPELSRLGVGHD